MPTAPLTDQATKSEARPLALAALFTAAVLFSVGATVAADRIVGAVKYHGADADGLLFPPLSKVRYETADFTFTATINGLGFRDRDVNPGRSAKQRVVAIGDSYTYGWGVTLDESWPKQLEAMLNAAGANAEVLNLGAPGASPADYANVAETAIPLLKPDLIVVAMLEGDDLEQLKKDTVAHLARQKGSRDEGSLVARTVRRMYPNLLRIRRELRRNSVPEENVTSTWKKQAATIIAEFDSTEKDRYSRIDSAVRVAFESGRLNPPMIPSAVNHPTYWTDTDDPSTPLAHTLEDLAAYDLRRIKRVADKVGARVLVISMPEGHYVDRKLYDRRVRFGFEMKPDMLVGNAPEDEAKAAAEQSGVDWFSVQSSFRAEQGLVQDSVRASQPGPHLFFDYDTHLNVLGHHFFAEHITAKVKSELESVHQPRRTASVGATRKL